MKPAFALPVLTILCLLVWANAPAVAHPHVWVTVETTVVYEKGLIKGFKHRWTFDDLYTAMATQGLDKNGDGQFTKAELTELAEANMAGIKKFGYFTFAKLGNQELSLTDPEKYWLEMKDGILALHFELPLSDRVLAESPDFSFSTYDPTYYIAFELSRETPIRLAGAPSGCITNVHAPTDDELLAKALTDALSEELAQAENLGAGLAHSVQIACPAS